MAPAAPAIGFAPAAPAGMGAAAMPPLPETEIAPDALPGIVAALFPVVGDVTAVPAPGSNASAAGGATVACKPDLGELPHAANHDRAGAPSAINATMSERCDLSITPTSTRRQRLCAVLAGVQ
jgi:hypothetical protein